MSDAGDLGDMGRMFNDLLGLLGQQGPDSWFHTAQQLAVTVARGDDGDPNPPVAERQRLETFAPLVDRHVAALLGVGTAGPLEAATRTALTLAALEQWRPLLGPRAASAPDVAAALGEEIPPVVSQMMGVLGPLFLGFQTGSVAGHFSERAWSLAALSLPREHTKRLVVVGNIATFAAEWSLDVDATTIFALARETMSSLVLSQPGLGDALRALLLDTVAESAAAQNDLLGRLREMGDPSALMGEPERLLDGLTPPADSPAVVALNAATAALSAYVDDAAQHVTEAIVGPQPALREAYRRFRRSDARGEDAAAALFGITLQGPVHDRAQSFVVTLRESGRYAELGALMRADGLPSAEELSNPDAWCERVRNSPLA